MAYPAEMQMHMSAPFNNLAELEQRRRALGMQLKTLAELSGTSKSTVERILSGRYGGASFDTVQAVARALGAELRVEYRAESEAMLRDRATEKAREMVRLTLGNAALESQGVALNTREATVASTTQRLLNGSRRSLWAD